MLGVGGSEWGAAQLQGGPVPGHRGLLPCLEHLMVQGSHSR